ncbi:hypothetical protein ScPMuIL_011725 [Solemya velum]
MDDVKYPVPRSGTIYYKIVPEFKGHQSDVWKWDGWGYRYYSRDLTGWGDARAICQAYNGHLAKIESKEENDIVVAKMLEISPDSFNNLGTEGFWIGGIKDHGTWRWQDGTEVTWSDWHQGEPDIMSQVNIAILKFGDYFEWANHYGNLGFVCEYNK